MELKPQYVLTLDAGTTSVRSLISDKKGKVIAVSQLEFTQYFPHSGWVEHDPIEIWNAQKTTMVNAKRQHGLKSTQLIACGITNQRETIVVWNKKTGLPIYNAIVWQDRRTSDFCDKLIKSGKASLFQRKTGLIINPYFSGTKLKWILDNVSGARQKAQKGEILAGTIDTWLIWMLTNGRVHATDVSNASRTLLFNIHTLQWDQELCKVLNIPIQILPEVKSSSDFYGTIEPTHFSQAAIGEVPITGVCGDQQSALFGQLCTQVGQVKNTYGTGCFTLVNTGNKAVTSRNKLLTTIAWKIGKQKTVYALEGSVFVAGAALQWLRDGLRMIYDAPISNYYAQLADSKESDQRIYFVPSFTGLGAPYWDSNSRGAIFGLERGTKREHIVRAALESIAYQSNDLLKAMAKDLKHPIKLLKVDGGAAKSDFLMQFQADISGLEVVRPQNTESTAMGAAFLAGLHVGFWNSVEELQKLVKVDRHFIPELNSQKTKLLIKGWDEAVKRTLNWTSSIK
ncbi:glycerol kinase GlpK [Mycoplasma sp. ATU-Cv-703]|uniref:glycerol kinase GlpK n=1 Tax=Mycoplasma sp. ATU-Cv-703 TaxID=2498595 RepID=UPI000FDD8C28